MDALRKYERVENYGTRAMALKRSLTPTARAAEYSGRLPELLKKCLMTSKNWPTQWWLEEIAVEYCSFYGDKTSKAVKGFFLNQLCSSWELTAHRGWARLLLDRRSFALVSNAPRRRALSWH